MKKQSVIIIGGGVAGLLAARQLSTSYEVTLLEALPRFGGRINTVNDGNFPSIIEAGAEFVHGAADETIKLLTEAGITIEKVEGEFYRNKDGVLKQEEGQVEGWDLLMEKMSSVHPDLSLQAFLDLHYSGERYCELRAQAIAFAEGFDLADKDMVSVKSLYKEWSQQSEDHRVNGGYSQLIDFLVAECLKNGCELHRSTVVKEILWTARNVQVSTSNQALYTADRCIITIPLGILKQPDTSFYIEFQPPINSYLNAVSQIGFGTVIKIVLSFNEVFWQNDAGFFFSDEEIPTWWTQLPAQEAVLTGWCGGTKGLGLSKLSDDQLLEIALKSLSGIFSLEPDSLREKLKGWKVFNWHKQFSSGGAYSYATTTSADVIELLNAPIEDTLYFAGEALYSGPHPGTVEAAVISAHKVVKIFV